MDMAGEMVGDLAAYLGVVDLSSTADFPKAMEDFKDVLGKVWGKCEHVMRFEGIYILLQTTPPLTPIDQKPFFLRPSFHTLPPL